MLLTAALVCGGLAVFFTVWIVVPAPSYLIFQVAVGASEWSLWFGGLALAGALLSLCALAAGSRGAAWVALSLGVTGVALASFPSLDAWRVARENRVELSLREYFFGGWQNSNGAVERTSETFASVEGQTLKLDIYQSRMKAEKLRPAIVVVHGGSWNAGERGDYPRWNEWLAGQGYVVFDVDYRIRPQPNWQTATGDVKCAVSWVKANASRYGVDAARIALLGRSAGGHLALLAAYSTGEALLAPSCANASDSSVHAVVALYAPTDLQWSYEHPANERVLDGPRRIRDFTGGTPASAAATIKLASATSHVNAQTPPTLLMHGGRDQLVRDENMLLLAERLRQQRVSHRALLIPYAQHGFDYNFNGWGSQIARQTMSDFLRTHLLEN